MPCGASALLLVLVSGTDGFKHEPPAKESWAAAFHNELADSGQKFPVEPRIPRPKPCPSGTYRSRNLVWTCGGQSIGAVFSVPGRTKASAIAILPHSVRDLALRAWTLAAAEIEIRSLAGDLLLRGAGVPDNDTIVSKDSGPRHLHGHGVTARYSGNVGDERISFTGTLSEPVLLSVDNSANQDAAAVDVIIDYKAIEGCSTNHVPLGCRKYFESDAREVSSGWYCSGRLGASNAWQILGQNHFEAHGGAVMIPWHEFGLIWGVFAESSSSSPAHLGEEKWKAVFKFLDSNDDTYLSKQEFEQGFHQCPAKVDVWGPSPLFIKLVSIVIGMAIASAIVGIACFSLMATRRDRETRQLGAYDRGKDWVPTNIQEIYQADRAPVKHEGNVCWGVNVKDVLTCGWRSKQPMGSSTPYAGLVPTDVRPRLPRMGEKELQHLPVNAGRPSEGPSKADAIMEEAGDDPAKIVAACAALGSSVLDRRDVVKTLVEAMDRHSNHPIIQVAACDAMSDIADVEAHAVVVGGGTGAVLSSLRNHPTHEGLQLAGIRTFKTLSLDSDGRSALLGKGAVAIIVQTMLRHGSAADLQEDGCLALSNIAIEAEAKSQMDSEVMQAIAEGMERHMMIYNVLEAGGYALYNIEYILQDVTPLKRVRADQILAEAVRNHPSLENVSEIHNLLDIMEVSTEPQ